MFIYPKYCIFRMAYRRIADISAIEQEWRALTSGHTAVNVKLVVACEAEFMRFF